MDVPTAHGRPGQHARQGSQSSGRRLSQMQDGLSYVQQMRMAKATVWAERGPRDAVNDARKLKASSSSSKKSRFGMRMFNGQAPAAVQAKPGKTKLRLYAAPQHTTLVPRLSASEANDNDEFDNFASSAPFGHEKRASTAPSIARSSLHHTTSRTNSLLNGTANHALEHGAPPSAPASPGKPRRMDSMASSTAPSSLPPDEPFTTALPSSRRAVNGAPMFSLPGGAVTTSRSGSPTQLQQYTTHHDQLDDSSDDDTPIVAESRPRLFIANADISDSD